MTEAQRAVNRDGRTISEIILRSARASERTSQRREGAEMSNTRTRGENVRRARIIDVDAQAVRTSIPVAPSRRCARSRSQRTEPRRAAPRRAAPRHAARRTGSR